MSLPRFLVLSALAAVLLDWSLASAQIAVSFQPKVTVAGPRIFLADIAVITPKGPEASQIGKLPVAPSPSPGKTKELYTVTVINSLRHLPETAEVDWQGSQTIMVERNCTKIGQEQWQEMIDGYLKENRLRTVGADIRFTLLRAPETVTLPPGKLTWKVTPSRPGIIGSTSFTVNLFIDNKPAGNTVVRGKLEAFAEVVVATETLHKGDVITDANIAMQQQDIGSTDNPILAKEPILGKQMAKTVNGGTILKQDHLVLPPVIKEGEMVKIYARKDSLQLTANGLARGDGRLGENIAVKNIASNKIIHGRVDGPGTVAVEF